MSNPLLTLKQALGIQCLELDVQSHAGWDHGSWGEGLTPAYLLLT